MMTQISKRLFQLTPMFVFILFLSVQTNAQTTEKAKNLTKEEIEAKKASGEKEFVVETKEEAAGKEKPVGVLGDADRPNLFIVDGKEFDPEKLNEIDPNMIESVQQMKGKKAKALYGDKAKKGVVVITLKKQ